MDDSDDQPQIKKQKTVKVIKKKPKQIKKKNNPAPAPAKANKEKVKVEILPQSDPDSADDSKDNDSESEDTIPFDLPTIAKKNRLAKLKELKERQLFLLYPKKLPHDQEEAEKLIKPLNDRIINIRLPRQKSFRWCILDFASADDRIKALKELSTVKVDGNKVVAELPKLHNQELLEKIAERRREKRIKLRQLKKLKKEATKQEVKKTYSSTIVVKNIPSSATAKDIKDLFPEAVDMRYTVAQGLNRTSIAYVTLPSPQHATKVKKQKHQFEGTDLLIEFSRPSLKRKSKDTESNGDVAKKPKIKGPTKLIKPKEKKNKAKKLKVAASPGEDVKPVIPNTVNSETKTKQKITKPPVAMKNGSPNNKAKVLKPMAKPGKPPMKKPGKPATKINPGKPAMKINPGKPAMKTKPGNPATKINPGKPAMKIKPGGKPAMKIKPGKPAMKSKPGAKNGTMSKKTKPNNKQKKPATAT